MPTMMTEPNIGSFFVPMISSKLFGYVTIFCTVTPTISASGRFSLARPVIRSKAARTLSSDDQVQHHAAHVGLVRDLRRMDLQHDRIADAMGHFHRLVGRAGRLRLGHRNLIGLQERLRDVLREDLAALR